jgi:hypothetical protein
VLNRRNTSAPGQALEFEIWAELIKQSQGALHVFLPLLDRGLDAVLHHLTDGRYIPIQVKGRSELVEGKVHIVVPADSLVDDSALLIGSLIQDVDGQLDLVIEERVFKTLAAREVNQGHEVYEAYFSMHPNRSHWRPYLVPRTQLGEHILGMSAGEAIARLDPDFLKPSQRHSPWLGFLGEAEVIRRLALNSRLDLFRPFPDLEIVEVLVRDNLTAQFAGLQVKAATVGRKGEGEIHVRKAGLTHARNTWLVGLPWWHETSEFDSECLLVPAADIPKVGTDVGGTIQILFNPKNPRQTRLDPYRRRLADLDRLIVEACARGRPAI